MKTDWQTKKLGEVCDVITDGVHNSPSYVETGIPMLDSKHIDDAFGIDDSNPEKFISKETDDLLSKRCKPKENDILISSRGSIGKIAIVREGQDFNIMGNIILLRLPKTLKTKFIVYSLHSELKNIEAIARGVAQKGLYLNQVRSFEIPLPPLPEQQRIVAMLDEAFAAIATAKENAEKNLQNARELFEPYLQGVFANPGDGWEEKPLGDKNLLEIIDGDRGKNYPKKSDFLEEGFCLFMNTKNVRPDGFDFETTMFINEKKDKALGNGKIKRNDVVMTTRGTIGNLGIYSDDVHYDNIRINSGMLIFRPNLKVIIPEYLFEILRSGIIKAQINKHVSGAAQPQLPIKTLVSFSFPVPKSLPEQRSIVAKLDALSAETKKLEAIYRQKLNDLDELKKSVLQKAFNGGLA